MKWMLSIPRLLLVLLMITLGQPGHAQERELFLNSTQLTPEQAQIFENLVGSALPDGRYWLDPDSGLWGYGDAPPSSLNESVPEDAVAPAEQKHYFEDEAAKFGFDIPPIQY